MLQEHSSRDCSRKQLLENVPRCLMTRWSVALCLLLAVGAMQSSHAATPQPQPAAGPVRVPGCPPPPETRPGGPSSIKATGPCAFELTGEAECSAEFDDFLLSVTRPGKNSTELMLFINVERYVGPRVYKAPNDMWVSLKDGSKMYRWSTNQFEATVGPGSKYVTFKDVHLEAEPILTGCTGPQTNYQCDGREDDNRFMTTSAIVTGTLYCKKAPPPKRSR